MITENYHSPFITTGWLKQYYTSIIVFDIVQFFLSLNYDFLSTYLKKV